MVRKWLVVFLSLALAASAYGAKNRLNLYIWSEYIDPDIVKDFGKQFDCKVVIDLYEDNESMMAKLEGGGVSQ